MSHFDRFDDASKTRQMIMDYCNQLGGSHKHKDVSAALGIEHSKVYRAMKAMERDMEATSTRKGRDDILWTMTATTTMSAHDMRERCARKGKQDNGRTKIKPQGAWHTVNYCDDNKMPIRNQGGQGSCGPLTATYLEVMA